MDAVILAAGRGSRLRGSVPAYHKPLLVVDKKPLVMQSIMWAYEMQCVSRVVVVCAPENVGPIVDLVEAHKLCTDAVRFVVQPDSDGPGAGFLLGFAATEHRSRVLLLMGDNTQPNDPNVWQNGATQAGGSITVGVKTVAESDVAQRFTRITEDGYYFLEGECLRDACWSDGKYRVWCGPLALDGDKLAQVLERVRQHEAPTELKIGRYLNDVSRDVRLRPSESRDIGSPDEL